MKLVFRKKTDAFNSIENVFNCLLPYLEVEKLEMPFESKGITNKLKNLRFLSKQPFKTYHLTGHDHYLVSFIKRKQAVLTIHDIEVLKRSTGIKRKLLKLIWFDWAIKNAKAVTTISEFTKNELIEIGGYKKEINVIPNPLTLPITYKPKSFNTDKPRILHIGTKKNKNLHRLILALKGIACHLVIIGKLEKEIQAELKGAEIEYSNKSNMKEAELIGEYQMADVVSLISTYEGFGLPILEAQACGRVVITSNISSMPEVAGEAAEYVDPFDVQSIRKGMLSIIENEEKRERLIHLGLSNVEKYQVQQIARRYRDIYSTLETTN